MDEKRFRNLAHRIIDEPDADQVIAKQNWSSLKQRSENLNTGFVVKEIDLAEAEN